MDYFIATESTTCFSKYQPSATFKRRKILKLSSITILVHFELTLGWGLLGIATFGSICKNNECYVTI